MGRVVVTNDWIIRFSKYEGVVDRGSIIFEPRREKTGFLHMRKQRRRSASR